MDTNLFVYAHDASAGPKREVARDLIAGLWRERSGCLSVQVLQELFVNLTRKVPRPLPSRDAAALVEDSPPGGVHSPGPRDILSAVELHEQMSVSFWDAMILTSARSFGCCVFYSEDLGAGHSYDGVRVVNPFASETGG
ncbi:PIN domain-containing protein [Rubrobacter marinus]|uniref:PIN domain-containing protein n=1 Tax=Rubrobacter marinus TaxID=2653852 RepID=A0A6G8PUN0_9ACTN|nr:PIN domain-containing protein [Rubrobacter marinus]QIN77505.1 PIN domain-containing protein [Rubrobacter marinus]